MTANMKYILCRPQGGLNDIFCQIEACCVYADEHRRVVVVDTAYSHSISFWEQFSNYFLSKQQNLVLNSDGYLDKFGCLSVYPESLKGRLASYRPKIVNGKLCDAFHSDHVVTLTFDFAQSYDQEVLVHQQFGGGSSSQKLPKRISINKKVLNALVQRLDSLPDHFDAVHVRHTDLHSNYETILAQLSKKLTRPIFLATDNAQVLEEFKNALCSKNIYSFSKLPENRGEALHQFQKSNCYPQINLDAILDLLTLSFAETLYVAPTTNNPHGAYSGFSRLAQFLHSDAGLRAEILRQPLLTEPLRQSPD